MCTLFVPAHGYSAVFNDRLIAERGPVAVRTSISSLGPVLIGAAFDGKVPEVLERVQRAMRAVEAAAQCAGEVSLREACRACATINLLRNPISNAPLKVCYCSIVPHLVSP